MMKRWNAAWKLLPILAMLALVLTACGRSDLSTLDPQGPVAQKQYDLMVLSIGIMAFVVIVVFAIALYVIVKFRRRKGDATIPEQVEGNHKLEVIWTVIPIILLIILGIPTIADVFTLATDHTKDKDAVQVKVVAHQYWWEFEYANGVKTAQELVVPNDARISITAETADVLHSFWIPSLAGKIDTNPKSNVNKMYFDAPKTGVYLGKCAELCGPSHSLMDFKVKVVDRGSFDRWLAAQASADEKMNAGTTLPADPAVAELFKNNCLSCHATGVVGPKLVGIGDRSTVAGILVNTDDAKYKNEGTTKENLVKWLEDPQAVKPGNLMYKKIGDGKYETINLSGDGIPFEMTAEQIDALADFLANYKLQ